MSVRSQAARQRSQALAKLRKETMRIGKFATLSTVGVAVWVYQQRSLPMQMLALHRKMLKQHERKRFEVRHELLSEVRELTYHAFGYHDGSHADRAYWTPKQLEKQLAFVAMYYSYAAYMARDAASQSVLLASIEVLPVRPELRRLIKDQMHFGPHTWQVRRLPKELYRVPWPRPYGDDLIRPANQLVTT